MSTEKENTSVKKLFIICIYDNDTIKYTNNNNNENDLDTTLDTL